MEEFIEKIEKEISRTESNGGHYWFDFDVPHDDAEKIKNHFSKRYTVELKPCKSCNGMKYEVIIYL